MSDAATSASTATAQRIVHLVVGADGLLGQALLQELTRRDLPGVGTVRPGAAGETGRFSLELVRDSLPPARNLPGPLAVVYLCAGVASPALCQSDPETTRRVNVEGTLRLARQALERGAHVVYPSTSQVFDGQHPFVACSAPPCPTTEYGNQRVEVERQLACEPGALIARLTKVLGPKAGALSTVRKQLASGNAVQSLADAFIAPLPTEYVARTLIDLAIVRHAGLVQLSACDEISYFDAACWVARRLGVDTRLVSAQRASETVGMLPPRHASLSAGAIARTLGLTMPTSRQSLESLMQSL